MTILPLGHILYVHLYMYVSKYASPPEFPLGLVDNVNSFLVWFFFCKLLKNN